MFRMSQLNGPGTKHEATAAALTQWRIEGGSQYLEDGLVVDLDILAGNPIIFAVRIVIVGGRVRVNLVPLLELGPGAATLNRVDSLAFPLFGLFAFGDALLDAGDTRDLIQELVQAALGGDMDIPVRVAQEAQEPAEEVGQVSDKLQVRDRVEQDDPADQEGPRKGIERVDAVPKQRDKALQGEGGGQLDRVF